MVMKLFQVRARVSGRSLYRLPATRHEETAMTDKVLDGKVALVTDVRLP